MNTDSRHDENNEHDFSRKSRRLLFAWIALIALLLSSLGSSYFSLGLFNSVISVGIAVLKSAIVVWLFMQMNKASALVRLAAASGIGTLVLLGGLTSVDYATRATTPAIMQPAQQLQPLLEER